MVVAAIAVAVVPIAALAVDAFDAVLPVFAFTVDALVALDTVVPLFVTITIVPVFAFALGALFAFVSFRAQRRGSLRT